MSYILEALRKADAEREQGAEAVLPGPVAQVDADAGAAAERPAPRAAGAWRWLVAGAAIPIAALLVWRLSATPEPAPTAVVAGTALPVQPGTASAVPAAASPPVAQAMAIPEPATAPPSAADPAPAAAPAAPAPVARVVRKPAARPAATPPQPAAAASQAPAAVPPLAALPDDLRRQVPAMVVGGSVYSPDPASRMLVVNGQVVREGTTLAPGLRLERIGREAAVFSIRGQSFELKL